MSESRARAAPVVLDRPLDETTFSLSRTPPQPDERRRDARHMTILRVGTLIVGDKRELCLIRNISAGGLMAHIYSPLEEGQRVAVELKGDLSIAGHVNWIQGSNAGIEFDAPIDVEQMLASHALNENGWRPRMPRVEVDRLGTLRVGARTYAVNTRDISQGGAKLEVDDRVPDGSAVVLSMQGLPPIQGILRWCQNGQCGIAFNEVIPFPHLIAWLRLPG